jgi:hypothetical protein
LSCIKNASGLYGAFYNGTVHISPKGTKAIGRDRKFGEYFVMHEVFHSRKRSTGEVGVDLSYESGKGHDSYYNAWARSYLEEGSTDLLSRKNLGLSEKYWSAALVSPMYRKHMGTIALLAGKATDWDREKAWDLVDDIHYHINDFDYMANLLDRTVGTPKGGWTGKSLYSAMLSLHRAAQYRGFRDSKWLLRK